MFTIEKLRIDLSRGDTAGLEVQFEGDVPQEAAGDKVVMSLKKTPASRIPLWEKEGQWIESDTILFNITTGDTSNLPFGTYYWDLRIFYADGQVTTPFEPKSFYLREVIGNDREP